MLLQMTVAVVLTAPPFGIVVLFSLFFRVLFLLFSCWLIGCCYDVRSEVSITFLSGYLTILFRLT
jgi:hypothetical protein